MSSLRGLIGEAWSEISNGVAWVVIYKDGRSWQAEAFYPVDGCYEDGYVFDADDYGRMKEILEIDRKALALNGEHGWGWGGVSPKDMTLKKLEDKVFGLYVNRYSQLWYFVEDFVIPPEETKGQGVCEAREQQTQVDSIISNAKARVNSSIDHGRCEMPELT